MDATVYTLQDAAALLGWDYERLKTMARRDKIPTVDIPYGQARIKKGITADTLAMLQQGEEQDRYGDMLALYLEEMRTGVWDGKGRALTPKWIAAIETSLKRYWSILGVKPSIVGVSAQNFKIVMASFQVDREAKKDYYSTKMHIYKAVTGLSKVLIRQGFKTKADLEAIREYRPGRVVTVKREFLDITDVDKALEINAAWLNGRSEYDRRLFDLLICLYAYAGVRKMEAANLRLDQVHMDKGYLHVYGKWAKERYACIFPRLAEKLTEWMLYREKIGMSSVYLVPQRDGTPLTETSIMTRFQRFKAHAKGVPNMAKINPHALRRTNATVASLYRMPMALLQRHLGHNHQSTTEGYICAEDRHLMDFARTFQFGEAPPASPPPVQPQGLPEPVAPIFW